MSFTEDPWNEPRFEEFKNYRDTSHYITDFEVVRPIVDKHLKGLPLTEAETVYLKRYYSANVCKQFFCRLGLTFKDNFECWVDSSPTDEQCARCEMNYLANDINSTNGRGRPVSNKSLLKNEYLGLYIEKDEQGVLQFYWKGITNPSKFPGLVGLAAQSVSIDLKTSMQDVYPVCLPSLSKSFKGGCDKQCDKCPAHGFFDASKNEVITGNQTVLIREDQLKPKMKENLDILVQIAKAEAPQEEPKNGETENPNEGQA